MFVFLRYCEKATIYDDYDSDMYVYIYRSSPIRYFPCMYVTLLIERESCVAVCMCVAVWLCMCVAVYVCGCVAVYVCSCVAVWLCSCVCVWLCSCVAMGLLSVSCSAWQG